MISLANPAGSSRLSFARLTVVLVAALTWAGAGCRTTGASPSPEPAPEQVGLLLPSQIRFIDGFSGFRDSGGDPNPEQVEVVLQPLNRFEEPTRMVGDLRIELYEFLPASGDNRGPRLCQWDIPLQTEEDQKKYWDRATRMYNLALVLGSASVTSGGKYVVEVTYLDPYGSRLSDTHTLAVVRRTPQVS